MLEELAAAAVDRAMLAARRHFLVANVLTALSGGVVYMGLALYTRSLWLAIMTHGIYDCSSSG
ncbi:CPBP family glutamic-type intramembrane protease [Rhodococcus opacus]|uniref:CPBP family glutamic-type intramembrane protease n=1 Tax=Rhodococcus opacus TaxID=37919 RepID=UPI002236322D|nr:CPBP family glutamic-type intramembrane protease [Rhodococcus opacus]UZG59666.1 CPBP family glutamic-type intramembrane protease [Rhodococcus opacus]